MIDRYCTGGGLARVPVDNGSDAREVSPWSELRDASPVSPGVSRLDMVKGWRKRGSFPENSINSYDVVKGNTSGL
jgi:hypothetical protein